MAENDQEKTEHKSQKKLEESREKGQLPRSQELVTFTVFAIFLLYFGMARLAWFDGLGRVMTYFLNFHRHLDIGHDTLREFLLVPTVKAMLVLAPLFAIILVVSPMVNMAQTGFNFAKDKLSPDWSRLDPVQGIKRIFSLKQLVEGLKSSIKIGLFALLACTAVRDHLPEIIKLPALPLREQLNLMIDLAMSIGLRIVILMGVLSVLDFGYQWWEFQKKLRMTPKELKDEMKEREGDPLIKQRQRSLQMQRMRERMMSEVPRADVVVTNPTHLAVALRYDREKAPAPYVCAKGADRMAVRIRTLAREGGIPVIEDKPLARALYRKAKVGKIIPGEFFKAVAEVLAFVYLMKRRQPSATPTPR